VVYILAVVVLATFPEQNIMQEIKASPSSSPRRYPNASTAIKASITSPEYARSCRDSVKLIGAIVEEVNCTNTAVGISLSGRLILKVFLNDRNVSWELLDGTGNPLVMQGSENDYLANDVMVHWETSGRATLWQRISSLQQLIGRPIIELRKPEGPLLLRFDGNIELSFFSIDVLPMHRRLLYWWTDSPL
jgi:hypothetical protein